MRTRSRPLIAVSNAFTCEAVGALFSTATTKCDASFFAASRNGLCAMTSSQSLAVRTKKNRLQPETFFCFALEVFLQRGAVE